MKTQTTKKALWLRSILLLPLLAAVLFSFSSKEIVERDLYSESVNQAANFQEKATSKMIKEYNALAKKYNSKSEEVIKINIKELKRMEYIYQLMSDAQREKVEPFPNIAPPAPPVVPDPPSPPMVKEIIEVKPSSKAPKPLVKEIIDVPPPPPPPKSPVQHIKEMAHKGAKFYYNNESISAAQALKLVSTKKKISLVTNHTNDSDYVVRLSSSPLVVKEDK